MYSTAPPPPRDGTQAPLVSILKVKINKNNGPKIYICEKPKNNNKTIINHILFQKKFQSQFLIKL